MNIRDKVKAALTKKTEMAAVETAAVKRPDPQLVLNIAKRFNKMLQPLADKYKLKILTGKLVRGAGGYVLPLVIKSEDKAQDVKLKRFVKLVSKLDNTGPGTSDQDVIKFGDYVAYAAVSDVESHQDQATIDVVIIGDKGDAAPKNSKAELKSFAKHINKTYGTGAPKGVNKLKAFMKENNIDLKTIKSMLKHL